MSNVLGDHRQQQVIALGRLGWSLRRIETATGVRRETASDYLKAAGIPSAWPGRPAAGVAAKTGHHAGVSTDPAAKPAIAEEVSTDSDRAKPATTPVSTDLAAVPRPGRAPSASACEPYRELIADALGRGRNAMAIWQDLVDDHGFVARYASVRRFVQTLRANRPAEARVVITTAAGEESQVDYGGDGPFRARGCREIGGCRRAPGEMVHRGSAPVAPIRARFGTRPSHDQFLEYSLPRGELRSPQCTQCRPQAGSRLASRGN